MLAEAGTTRLLYRRERVEMPRRIEALVKARGGALDMVPNLVVIYLKSLLMSIPCWTADYGLEVGACPVLTIAKRC